MLMRLGADECFPLLSTSEYGDDDSPVVALARTSATFENDCQESSKSVRAERRVVALGTLCRIRTFLCAGTWIFLWDPCGTGARDERGPVVPPCHTGSRTHHGSGVGLQYDHRGGAPLSP